MRCLNIVQQRTITARDLLMCTMENRNLDMFTAGCLIYCGEKSGTSNYCKYCPTPDSVQNVNKMYHLHSWY